MTYSSPAIVNIKNNDMKRFANVNEIIVGRNKNCPFDIPDPAISRTQCIFSLSEDNNWIIKDQSRHKSTLLNGKRILNEAAVIKSGDLFSFQSYQSGVFAFFYSYEDLLKKYKKRKSLIKEVPHASKVPRLEGENINSDLPDDFNDSSINCKPNNFTNVLKELEKYKSLYSDAVEDLKQKTKAKDSALIELTKEKNEKEAVLVELKKEKMDKGCIEFKLMNLNENLSKVKQNEAEKSSTIAVLNKEKEMLREKLKNQESFREAMVLKIQDLTECLKESEQEQIRILNESNQSKCESKMSKSEDQVVANKKIMKEEGFHDTVTAEEIQDIVGLVEVQYKAEEIKKLNLEVLKKDDKITDLVTELEKYKQDLLETIDREMLCMICSEVIYHAITLNCKHTYCKACITEWKKKKKECPVCRAKIKSEVHPLAIDSFIDRLFDVLGGELKSRREAVKVERSRSALEVPSTSKGCGGERRSVPSELVNRTHRRSRRNIPTMTSAMSILEVTELLENIRGFMDRDF